MVELMLKPRNSQNSTESELDMTSMLDVIFIVLIFFVVSANFVKEQAIPIEKAKSSARSEPQNSIVLKLYLNDRVEIQGRSVTTNAVRATLLPLLQSSQLNSLSVIVHRNAKTQSVVKILDEIESLNLIRPSVSLMKS